MQFAKITKLLVFVFLIIPFALHAQKDTREKQAQLSYEIQKDGPQTVTSNSNFYRSQLDQLTSQIRIAKKNGDLTKIEQLNHELETVPGIITYNTGANLNGPQISGEVLNIPVEGSLTDYNSTLLSGQGFWANATSTDRVTGRIWAVGTQNNVSASDTLKIFTSVDNGISWTLVYKLGFVNSGVHFNNDELDVEAVNNGTASYAFMVAGLTYGATDYSFIFRLNSSGTETFFSYLFTTASFVKHNNPRITSDNSNYTSGSYVYFILTQDSIVGTAHYLKTKLGLLTSPFTATPVLTYRNNSGANGAYWWNLSNAGDTSKLYNDIAYSDSATSDVIITVSNFYKAGLNNLYFSYSKDYGATTPYWFPQVTETNVNYKPRLASTGFDDVSGMQYLMLTYTRQFSATDWDPYSYRTTNNGAAWTSGYIDATSDTTFYTDVTAIPRVPNTFRTAYGVRTSTNGNVYMRSYNNGTFLTKFMLNPSPVSGSYTPIRAGYRYSADSCFNTVEGIGGGGLFAYSGCSGTLTGVGNNESQLTYNLSQNYPNPFNPVTKISYSLPKSGIITLKVYDILGKEVATLVNELKNAGNYSVDFNASSFPSGIYFYKLESNGFNDVKKMILVK